MNTTLYWHDYETWGATPQVDRPCQFAGVRTDESLNIIGEPLVLLCKPPPDIWPHPQACHVTGLDPQRAQQQGLSEREFIARIHEEFSRAGTCALGYNTLRFDDEVTRFTLFRNFYDPYEREWRNGNSRWDLIDMVRTVYALRPEGFEWPEVEGRPSFRLELLTAANGIDHGQAHDAYADVEATIALARHIRARQPKLYHYLFSLRDKRACAELIDIEQRKPLLHVSSKFPATQGCASLIAPIAFHPTNKTAVIVWDLREDPRVLAGLDAATIRDRVFTREENLPTGQKRLPLKLIHLNKCPVLVTPKVLSDAAEERIALNRSACERHWHSLLKLDVAQALREAFGQQDFETIRDPEQQLYEGFVSDADKRAMVSVRKAGDRELADSHWAFKDSRLAAMLPRYRARNFSDSLNLKEQEDWAGFVRDRLQNGGDRVLSRADFLAEIEALAGVASPELIAKLRDWDLLQAERWQLP